MSDQKTHLWKTLLAYIGLAVMEKVAKDKNVK